MWCKSGLVFLIYIVVLNLFGVFVKLLEYTNFILQYNIKIDPYNSKYDYIVVGSGSAGATIARRLALNKNDKILILEAGPMGNRLLDIPSLGILLQNTHFSWNYTTIPQTNACLALEQNKSFWPYGKIVGGTGMMNNMLYARGHAEDFEGWFKYKQGYSFKTDVEPYFKRIENFRFQENEPISDFATNPSFSSILPYYLLSAAKFLGFPVLNSTLNCDKGFGVPVLNQRNGARWTTSHYIFRGNYPNIFLYTNSEVQEILLYNNFEAYGVKYKYLNSFHTATAKKGIILSAGVIGTPKILLHSGIGPKDHLHKINIPTKVNLPVGENLQDHVTTGLDLVLLNQSLGIGIEQMFSPFAAFKYFWDGKGPWTTGGCETMGFLPSKLSKSSSPDIQFMAMPVGISEDGGIFLRKLFRIKDEVWNKYFRLLNRNHTMTILPVLLHPKSRGSVRLKDNHFDSELYIDPNYLSHKDDINTLMEGVDVIKQLIKTESMQKLGAKLNTNIFPGCENFVFDTKLYWECYIRRLTITSYHSIGTCKMGLDEDNSNVVNYNFQVKHTNKLFIVDGSVLPNLPSGNVNGAIIMLAEMASDILKLRNYYSQGKCTLKELFVAKDIC